MNPFVNEKELKIELAKKESINTLEASIQATTNYLNLEIASGNITEKNYKDLLLQIKNATQELLVLKGEISRKKKQTKIRW